MKPGKVIGAALAAALLLPAAAGASTVQVTASGELRIDGASGEASQIEVLYRTADEAGFLGQSDRFVVADAAGAQAASASCAGIDAGKVSCDARPVSAIAGFLADGPDVFAVNRGKDDRVPADYDVRVEGGTGNDVIRGGDGVDRISGGAGRDVVAGELGEDALSGGPGTDAVIGFGGDDRLRGDGGGDAIFAGKGRDRMLGGSGKDALVANDGIRDARIDCGSGSQEQAVIDGRDPHPRGCGRPVERALHR